MKINDAADLLVETLRIAGVERVYGITGDSANHITDALARSTLRFIHTRHEETAAFAAGAEAAVTGKVAVCMGSCGPGSLHLINGLYDAHRNGSPVLALVTEIDKSQIGTRFIQEIDTQNTFKGCSAFCQYVQSVEQMPRIIGIAMQTAIACRGVAVVIIPGAISSAKLESAVTPEYLPFYTQPRITPSEEELYALAYTLNNSHKVAIFGGAGCIGANRQVMELAQKLKAPVVWSYRGKEALDHNNPFPAGMTGIMGCSAGTYALEHCDTLLLLGCGFAFTTMYPQQARIIQIDINGENLARRHNIAQGYVGDIAPTLDLLLPKLNEKTDVRFGETCTQMYREVRQHLQKLTEQDPDSKRPIYPEKLTALLNDKVAPQAWITADMGTPWAFAGRYMASKGERRFYTSSLHGSMAGALPSAIGLSLALPDTQQVVALCGDGGLSMLLGELLTVKQEKLSPKIFIYNNSSLDFVAMEMKADGLLDSYTYLENPNFAAVAIAMGIKGIRVEKIQELEAAVDEALACDEAVVVDVIVDGNSMLIPPHITTAMAEKYSHYVAKMIFSGNMEELLEEAVTNLRTV